MSIDQEVLAALKRERGSVLSGEQLAGQLGVSRNSIWKAVNALRARGYPILASSKTGYSLVEIGNALSAADVYEGLEEKLSAKLRISVQDEVTSTNTLLKELAEQGEDEGAVLIAQRQTFGKGRLGRSFSSPFGCGLYMSVLLRPSYPAEKAVRITSAAAVAVCQAIEAATGIDTGIKWVNDIYVKKKKVCGLLTEAAVNFETNTLAYAVLGIGINVQTPPGGFPPEISDTAIALYDEMPQNGIRAKLAASILTHFFRFYNEIDHPAIMEAYRSRSILTGCTVAFTQGVIRETGIVVGIDDSAALLVQLKDGTVKRCVAGEVQILKEGGNWREEE